jgi:hypothetical protein
VNAVGLGLAVALMLVWAWKLTDLIRSTPAGYRVMSTGRWLDVLVVVVMAALIVVDVAAHTAHGATLPLINGFTALEAAACFSWRTYYRRSTS